MASLKVRMVAAYKAFREPMLVSQGPEASDDFSAFESRQVRYAMNWAMFENTFYRQLHAWAHTYKILHGLYRYTRNIYNPTQRLTTFYQEALMGGRLDPAAGDGDAVQSALPIMTENARLRPAIAELWKWSRWQTNKGIFTLHGPLFGDAALEIVDDVERARVYLKVVNPSIIADAELDPFGSVKGYVIEEARPHPTKPKNTVTYTEVVSREGDDVVYQTYMNGKPYAWNGRDEWREPYGFVPMVLVKHNDVGLDWGWSELHPGRPKFHEVDDLASKLSDQIRKAVNAQWAFSGVDMPSSTPMMTSRDSETYKESSDYVNRPEPGREELSAIYLPDGGSATPLVFPLDIKATLEYIQDLLHEMERDYPELQMDIWTSSGDASGRALRVARQRVEKKVLQRRDGYDDALVRAQQMAIAVGGFRGYDGYEGFGLESYGRGELEHSIGARPVFPVDPLDEAEIEQAQWETANKAVATGMPLEFYIAEELDWPPDKMARLRAAIEAQRWQGLDAAPPWVTDNNGLRNQRMGPDGEPDEGEDGDDG